MKITVCWKWVSLDREREADRRWSGVSAADEAALEVALRIAENTDGEVHVIGLGPASVDGVLRDALAAGATTATRIDASTELDSHVVAVALGQQATGSDLVLCGDYSLDRGTGSVPAFLAHELAAGQALGLLAVHANEIATPDSGSQTLRVVRRLDGGRREILDVTTPAVLSVEGSVAKLRRASLAASLDTRTAPIDVVRGPHGHLPEAEVHPYRPRPRALPAPTGDSLLRVRQILDVGGGDTHAELVTLDPAAAAAKILHQLGDWGYLGSDATPDESD